MAETDTGKRLALHAQELAGHIAECRVRWQNIREHVVELRALVDEMRKRLSPKSGSYWLKSTAAALPLVLVIAGAATYAMDSRYITTASLELAFAKIRYRELEDKIFELSQIPEKTRTVRTRALLDRYLRELQRIEQQIANEQ